MVTITHYAEDPRFCQGMNAPSATGCRISILRLFELKVDFVATDSCWRGATLELQEININLFHPLFLHIKHVKKGIYPCFNEGE